MKHRKVSIVNILSRVDVGEFHNSRRIGVNLRLAEKCISKQVEFVEVHIDTKCHLSQDGLHLNMIGQDFVGRKIFEHCKQRLN